MINIIKKEDLLAYIQSRIYVIRGQKIMMDRDLAELYGVETRTLNQKVKRNLRRFPPDFMFQMNKEDIEEWKSQIVISNSIKMGLRKPPYAFTQLGVAMLSSVLRSTSAIKVNRDIMRAFVSLRHIIMLPDTTDRLKKIEQELESIKEEMNETLADQNDINESTRAQLDAISTALADLQSERNRNVPRRRIGFI